MIRGPDVGLLGTAPCRTLCRETFIIRDKDLRQEKPSSVCAWKECRRFCKLCDKLGSMRVC
jgi:hypothetical protein